jgi:hypothetical protein
MDLAQLRRLNKASRDALRDEIEERELELEGDPLLAHDTLMAKLRGPEVTREAPRVIYKTTDNGNGYDNTAPASPLSNDELVDAVAQAMAQMRQEVRAEFEARIATLEGQVSTLLSLLGGSTDGATRSRSLRKRLQDDGHLLEAPRRSS